MNRKSMRWIVTRTAEVDLELISAFKARLISSEDIAVIKRWTLKVEEEGPQSLYDTPFWGDHALDGEWRGFRSSCFSKSGRIIYRIIDEQVEVHVVRVTPDHNYKRD